MSKFIITVNGTAFGQSEGKVAVFDTAQAEDRIELAKVVMTQLGTAVPQIVAVAKLVELVTNGTPFGNRERRVGGKSTIIQGIAVDVNLETIKEGPDAVIVIQDGAQFYVNDDEFQVISKESKLEQLAKGQPQLVEVETVAIKGTGQVIATSRKVITDGVPPIYRVVDEAENADFGTTLEVYLAEVRAEDNEGIIVFGENGPEHYLP